MGERDPHRSRRVAAVDAAVRVIGGEDLLVIVARTSPPARAPLAHSEPVTVAAALEQEAAEMEGGRISDLEPAAARVELGCQGEVADGGGGERHQREVHGRRPSNRLSQWARIGGDLLAVDTLPGQVDEVAGRPGARRIVADAQIEAYDAVHRLVVRHDRSRDEGRRRGGAGR